MKTGRYHVYVLYGLVLGTLLFVLQVLEYRALVRDLSQEVFGGIIALIFIALGTWVGISFAGANDQTTHSARMASPRNVNAAAGLSERELEVLQLLAQGCSNREISNRLYVSVNTVKTHISNIYFKLRVNKRIQAVQRAKELAIIG